MPRLILALVIAFTPNLAAADGCRDEIAAAADHNPVGRIIFE